MMYLHLQRQMKERIQISDKTVGAICAVASECLYDMDARGARSRRVMAEVVLDADRLRTWGFREAHEEIKRLINLHGYDAVHKAVCKFIPTA